MLCGRSTRPAADLGRRVLEAIEQEWQSLLRAAASRYMAVSRVDSIEIHRRFLSETMTMASIVAWREGLWVQCVANLGASERDGVNATVVPFMGEQVRHRS